MRHSAIRDEAVLTSSSIFPRPFLAERVPRDLARDGAFLSHASFPRSRVAPRPQAREGDRDVPMGMTELQRQHLGLHR